MATPWFPEYIELVGATATLLLGSRAIWCGDDTDLLLSGPSRGSNSTIGATIGTLGRDRIRGELGATLQQVTIDGAYDQDNAYVASGQRANCLSLMRVVIDFFEEDCVGRGFTLRRVEPTQTWEATAQLEQVGAWAPLSDVVTETELSVTLSTGLMTLVAP